MMRNLEVGSDRWPPLSPSDLKFSFSLVYSSTVPGIAGCVTAVS
jgi:hypothetical protein